MSTVQSVQGLRAGQRLFATVSDVPNLFSVSELAGRNPGCSEVQLVEAASSGC